MIDDLIKNLEGAKKVGEYNVHVDVPGIPYMPASLLESGGSRYLLVGLPKSEIAVYEFTRVLDEESSNAFVSSYHEKPIRQNAQGVELFRLPFVDPSYSTLEEMMPEEYRSFSRPGGMHGGYNHFPENWSSYLDEGAVTDYFSSEDLERLVDDSSELLQGGVLIDFGCGPVPSSNAFEGFERILIDSNYRVGELEERYDNVRAVRKDLDSFTSEDLRQLGYDSVNVAVFSAVANFINPQVLFDVDQYLEPGGLVFIVNREGHHSLNYFPGRGISSEHFDYIFGKLGYEIMIDNSEGRTAKKVFRKPSGGS